MRIDDLNQLELDNKVPPESSWHNDYNDTPYVYVSGFPKEMTEGDLVILFSQYGTPTHVVIVRDKATGRSKGYGFLRYEDQRSTVLAIDNFNGIRILGNTLKVDHARYKHKPDESIPPLHVLYDDPSLKDVL
ncbi:RNA-binding motif protein, X-linked 2 [Wickerhamiella sorbophila]|uniref:RNA-binding motif protein, X-linked 2 n=1 Tax=Wickerhamiella sorbophila TaxID=45607 RepID=A0A2T0FJF8_9ASCO|nr:RNA-binding motif protein, X-linked 2 [Wickerhamiella sorbophila]PRT55128.1 RNA-binding motif protein, X-linked 2 [Wickerhamiella sorbophila]